jgi:uncharacterized membrane protein YphA (DoxX/SURF4 family)
MKEILSDLAPLPLRLIVAANLVYAGLQALSSPPFGLPAWAAWLIGVAEILAGLAFFVGLFVRPLALLALLAVLGALLLGVAGPLVPDAETGAVLSSVLLSLLLGGAGPLSLDAVRTAWRMQALTVLAKVRPGEEAALAEVLTRINDNLYDNPYVRFLADHRSHFARWVLLDDPENGTRLLFVTTYNGPLASYVEELVRASPGLDEIWGRCEGYTGKGDFLAFVRRFSYATLEPFYGFLDETVDTIREKIQIRRTIESFLAQPEVARFLDRPGVAPFLDGLSSLVTPPGLLRVLWNRLRSAVSATLHAIHQVILFLALRAADWFAQIGQPKHFPLVPESCGDPEAIREYIRHVNELEAFDNRFLQNQLTLYVKVKPGRLLRLGIALFGATFVNRYGCPPGEITGVFTIHDFHWVIIDGGKRAIFMSNYDGSMINYIGDFVDKFGTGLDVFMNNTVGYPPGGVRQTWAFTEWLLGNQVLCQSYYSAYPRESVINIIRDRTISAGLTAHYDRGQWERWLRLL